MSLNPVGSCAPTGGRIIDSVRRTKPSQSKQVREPEAPTLPRGPLSAPKPLDPPFRSEEWRRKQAIRRRIRDEIDRLEREAARLPKLQTIIEVLAAAIEEVSSHVPIEVAERSLSPVMSDAGRRVAQIVIAEREALDLVRDYFEHKSLADEAFRQFDSESGRRRNSANIGAFHNHRAAMDEIERQLRLKLREVADLSDVRYETWLEELFEQNRVKQAGQKVVVAPNRPVN